MRFEFNSDFDVSATQMEEVVNYWFNSHDDSFNTDTVGNYTIDVANPDRGYFAQLAWAKSFMIGKSVFLLQIFYAGCSNKCPNYLGSN